MSAIPASAPAGAVVRKTLLVDCPRDHAFRVFTASMGRWWPATHHVGTVPFRDVVIEPRAGGRWYEIDTQDKQGQWGKVLAWEPPQRVVLSWHLDTKFEFHEELSRASELEFSFHSEGPRQTRVEFEHRHIERHGEGYEKLRDLLDGGWVFILGEYTKLAQAEDTQAA